MFNRFLELIDYRAEVNKCKIIIYNSQNIKIIEYENPIIYPLFLRFIDQNSVITINVDDPDFNKFNIGVHYHGGTELFFHANRDELSFNIFSPKERFKYGLDITSKKIVWTKNLTNNNYMQTLKYAEDAEDIFQISESLCNNQLSLKKECLITSDKDIIGYYILKSLVNDENVEDIASFKLPTAKDIARHLMATESIKNIIRETFQAFQIKIPNLVDFINSHSILVCLLLAEIYSTPKVNSIFEDIVSRSHIISGDVEVLFSPLK